MEKRIERRYAVHRKCFGVKLLSCGFLRLPPGDRRLFKSTPNIFGLTFMEKGNYKVHYLGDNFELSSGDLFILRPRELKIFQNISNAVLEEYWFVFEVDEMDKFAKQLPNKPIHIGSSGKIQTLLRETYRKASNKVIPPEKLASLFLQALSEIMLFSEVAPASENESKINKICAMIHKGPDKNYDFKKLALEKRLNYCTFRHLFKEMTGFSPGQYLTRERTRLACDYLLQGRSVKETCFKVGYADQYYFSRVFKKIMNQTPTEFKKTHTTLLKRL